MKSQGENRAEVGIMGQKLGMTQVFGKNGELIPVTVLQAGPCNVLQIKTSEKHGYNAIQVGFGAVKDKHLSKPQKGHFSKNKGESRKLLGEFRQNQQSLQNYSVGQEIKCDIFKVGDLVDVTATSIGKGFQGVMKRHNMSGAKSSHGVHEAFRHGGSLGCRFPQHVAKGKSMAGHLGDKRVTIQNQTIVDVRPEQNLLLIRGCVPGKPKNSWVIIRRAGKVPAAPVQKN